MHTHAHTHTHARTQIHTYIQTHMRAHTHTHMNTEMYETPFLYVWCCSQSMQTLPTKYMVLLTCQSPYIHCREKDMSSGLYNLQFSIFFLQRKMRPAPPSLEHPHIHALSHSHIQTHARTHTQTHTRVHALSHTKLNTYTNTHTQTYIHSSRLSLARMLPARFASKSGEF